MRVACFTLAITSSALNNRVGSNWEFDTIDRLEATPRRLLLLSEGNHRSIQTEPCSPIER